MEAYSNWLSSNTRKEKGTIFVDQEQKMEKYYRPRAFYDMNAEM